MSTKSVPNTIQTPAVDIQGLWTVYGGGNAPEFVVHKDLDLQVAQGEILSLVGGSGTGKTTLLRQILGLETPRKGRINVMGQPRSAIDPRTAASRDARRNARDRAACADRSCPIPARVRSR